MNGTNLDLKKTDLNYILAVDESTYNPKVQWGEKKAEGMGKLHPIAWYHNYDGGRSFYTALGHIPPISVILHFLIIYMQDFLGSNG